MPRFRRVSVTFPPRVRAALHPLLFRPARNYTTETNAPLNRHPTANAKKPTAHLISLAKQPCPQEGIEEPVFIVEKIDQTIGDKALQRLRSGGR